MSSSEISNDDFQAILDRAAAVFHDRPDHARELIDQAWGLVRPRADELFALAQVLDRMGDDRGLDEVAERLGQMDGKRPRVALALGRVLRMRGKTTESLPQFIRAAKRGPKIADTHIALTAAYLDAGQPEAALEAGQGARALHPNNLALGLNVMRAEAALDPLSVDLDQLDRLIEMSPGRAAAQRFRLSLLRRLRRMDAARKAVAEFAKACPRQCDAALELASLDMLAGEPRAAQRRLEPELALSEPSLDRLDRLGQAYAATRSTDGVASVLDRLAGMAETPQRWAVVGRLSLAAKDHEAALDAFERVLELDPHRAGVWGQLLEVMTQLGRGAAAFERYKSAPKSIQSLPEIVIKASNAAWADGQVDEALLLLQGPDMARHTAVVRHLTDSLASVGQIGAARERLVNWRPKSQAEQATRLIGLGVAARAEYDFLDVERLMEAALEADPNRIAPLWHLAHTRFVLNNPEGAMAAWKEMIAKNRAAGVQTMKHQGTLLWHKAEEQQLNPETTQALAHAFRVGPLELRHEAVRALMAGIDMIGPALSLMIALRQLGMFPRFEAGESPIPKKIHQYWEGPMPADLAQALDRMRALNPDSDYRLYDKTDARGYLEAHADKDVVRAFDLTRHAAERADLFRLVLLGREGGIYVDADDLCRGSVRDFLPEGSQTVLFQEYHGALANNFIATVPENPILDWALRSAVEETLSGSATSIWLRTGPGLITRAAAHAFANHNGDPLPDWYVLCQTDMVERLVICAPFSYKLDHRHWMKMEQVG